MVLHGIIKKYFATHGKCGPNLLRCVISFARKQVHTGISMANSIFSLPFWFYQYSVYRYPLFPEYLTFIIQHLTGHITGKQREHICFLTLPLANIA